MCQTVCNTPVTTQMLPQHVAQVQAVCRTDDVFLIVRPSEAETTTLIGRGFATKNMDVHDKSSNWGLTAGMVPKDARFSKNGNASNVPVTSIDALQARHNMAKTIPLRFKPEWFSLIGTHFKVTLATLTPPAGKGAASCSCGGPVDFPNGQPGKWRHYRSDSAKNAGSEFCFLMSPDNYVSWRWSNRAKNVAFAERGVPLYVWAYEIGGNWLPCTGDYDVWMLAPRIGTADAEIVRSVKDNYGRSAATDFYTKFLTKLNIECGRANNKVFHHGAEAQNYSFTQELKKDESMPVICPGTHAPFMVESKDVPQLVYQMLQWGYIATLNPKWRKGITLMAEDTGYAMEDHLHLTRGAGMALRSTTGTSATGAEKASQDALAQVETSAVLTIQRYVRAKRMLNMNSNPTQALASWKNESSFVRANKAAQILADTLRKEVEANRMTQAQAIDQLNRDCYGGQNRGMALTIYNKFSWKERFDKLQIFRRISEATGLAFTQSGVTFPATLSKPMTTPIENAGERARLAALAQERTFGRARFDRHDDGHGHVSVTPVDETRT